MQLYDHQSSATYHTWVKKHYGFQAGIFVVIYLKLLEGKHQLIQDPHCYPAHLQLWAVPGNNVVVSCKTDENKFLIIKSYFYEA